MRATLVIAALIFGTPVQATRGSVDIISNDSLEIQIRQNDSLYKEVLRLHRRADELIKMKFVDLELVAIRVAELARTQQMKKTILGGLDLSFSAFAAKVSPRLANGSLSVERALKRQNERIENYLRRAKMKRIIPPLSGRNYRMILMCREGYMFEWAACASPYHALESNGTTITLTASSARVDGAIDLMRLKSKINKPLAIVGIAVVTAIMAPIVVVAIAIATL